MTSLGVEGLVVAVDVAALHLLHSTKKLRVNCSDDGTDSNMHDNMDMKRGSLSNIGHTYIHDLS